MKYIQILILDSKFSRNKDFFIVATPTDFNEVSNYFDTSSVESVIDHVLKNSDSGLIVIKSTVPVGFTEDLNKTKKTIESNKNIKFRKLLLKKDVSKISVIGVGMITTPGVTFRMFQTLANKKINIQVISTSEIKISVLIDKRNAKKALVALHKEFKLDHKKWI